MRGRSGPTRVIAAGPTVAAAVVLASAAPARAQPHQVHELKHEVALDMTVTLGALTVMVVTESLKERLVPPRCRWCDRDAEGNDVLNPVDRGVRSWVKWDDGLSARRISDVTAFLVAPATSIGTMTAASARDGASSELALDMLLVLEATFLSGVLNQLAKFTAVRERPFVHALGEEEKRTHAHRADDNLSFYSGHTSFTFSLAAGSGTVASLRDYRLAPLVWSTLLPMAALTGYMRIAGDRHYFTDVLTGAILGTAVGVLVPLAFHGRASDSSSVPVPVPVPVPAPVPASPPPMLSFGGTF